MPEPITTTTTTTGTMDVEEPGAVDATETKTTADIETYANALAEALKGAKAA